MYKYLCLILGALAPLAHLNAQDSATPSTATLSLEEAQTLARRNNPVHLSQLSRRNVADAGIRSAYGQLLPSADASFSALRQEGGRQIFNGGSFGASSDINQSQYRIGLSYRLNSATFIAPRLQRANREAVEAEITGSTHALGSRVTERYLSALQAEDRAELQDTLLAAARNQLVLAQAQALVGSATQLDVQRAEIAVGQQQVQLLQARNQAEIEKLNLFELLGIAQPAKNIVLTTEFRSMPEPPPLEELLSSARTDNPDMLALRSRERVAELNVKRSRGEYSPTLSISTGISGYTYSYVDPQFLVEQSSSQLAAQRASCVRTEQVRAVLNLENNLGACNAMALSDAQISELRRENSGFPFRFQSSPRSLSATLSLPLFDGFGREQRVQEAQASAADARFNLRAAELSLTTGITAAYLTLRTARQTAELQAQNSGKARLEVEFTQERYRQGSVSFLDLVEARAAYERAESDRINAIYDYHKAFAALESAVGRRFR